MVIEATKSNIPLAPGVRQDGPPADPTDVVGNENAAGAQTGAEVTASPAASATAAAAAPASAPVASSVSSTSDQRTINNVMRHEYKVLSEEEKLTMKTVKDMGLEFHSYIKELGNEKPSRELSIAATKIEEAVMWAVKHITG